MRKNAPYPLYETEKIENLRELLERKAEKCPDRIAFAYWKIADGFPESADGGTDRVLVKKTFAEVAKEVAALGEFFINEGFRGAHIALFGENSYEWLIAFLGIVGSGNIAVPFDKEMDTDEINEVLARIGADAVCYSERCAEKIQNTNFADERIRKYSLNKWEDNIPNSGKNDPSAYRSLTLNPNTPCCIFLTSGTTGGRKGVILTHKNIAANIYASCALFELNGDTYVILPFHHAFGLIVGVLMVFHYGHTAWIGSSLRRMRTELPEAKPQTMMLVPLFVESFRKQLKGKTRKEALALFGGKLSYIICGGAMLDETYIEEFRALGVELLNGYGITECSHCVSVNRNRHHKDGSVGLPVPGSEIRIASDGEVLIRGEHVMSGYYGDNTATKEAFTGDGFYKTGDLGRMDADGFLYLTGRKKNLIIGANGENISPEELELRLRRVPGVDGVLVYENKGLLCAEIYVEDLSDETKKRMENDIGVINRKLPMYKRIGKVIFCEKAPETTGTGKIRRRIRNEWKTTKK